MYYTRQPIHAGQRKVKGNSDGDVKTKERKEKKEKGSKDDATTYFGCTVAPDDSCGAPSHAVPPSDALLASRVPLHPGDPGIAGRRKSPAHWDWGAYGMLRSH